MPQFKQVESTQSTDAPQSVSKFQQTQYKDLKLSQAFYSGASITTQQSLLLVLTFILNYSLNGAQASAMLDLLRVILPNDAIVPTSLDSLVEYLLDIEHLSKVYYCSECRITIPSHSNQVCSSCQQFSSQFFLFKSVSSALQEKLQQTQFVDAISYYSNEYQSNTDHISDIYDGEMYQQHCMPITKAGGLSLLITTDGISPYKHGTTQFWPIYGIVNELPPSLRFNKENMLFFGLWPTNTPDFQVFFAPMQEELTRLYHFGHNFCINKTYVNKRIVMGPCTLDMSARYKVYGMKAYNGYFGCSFCLNQGENKNRKMYYPIRTNDEMYCCIPRDDISTLEFCEKALEQSEYLGHVDYSAFTNFPTYGFVSHQVLDWMHMICLGVFKSILRMMLESTNHNEEYYVSKKEWKQVDRIWTSNLFPSALQRHPRSLLEHFNHFKANEIRNFMFYGFEHCMKNILIGNRQKYFDSTMQLIRIVKELDSTAISKQRLKMIEEELALWVLQFATLRSSTLLLALKHRGVILRSK